jgi:hypothetical protein
MARAGMEMEAERGHSHRKISGDSAIRLLKLRRPAGRGRRLLEEDASVSKDALRLERAIE